MEWKIGEIFEYNGEWYQCVNIPDCTLCDLRYKVNDCLNTYPCVPLKRKDGEDVIFKKLEKVGEPFEIARDLKFQKYKVKVTPLFYNGDRRLFFSSPTEDFVYIEVKQNKENMEEKKLNLKPFDLEAAKLGKPVCTRDGRKARIICFDVKGNKPIVALIEYETDERPCNYFANGRFYSNSNENNNADLMMLPEKKEGWVNIYIDHNENYAGELVNHKIYKTEKDATIYSSNKIKTIKIEWEE